MSAPVVEQHAAPPPATTKWVPVGPGMAGIPTPVVNGQWVKGAGGAAVWAGLTASPVANLALSAANVDVTLPDPAVAITAFRVNPGGGSIRSIQRPSSPGAVVKFSNVGSPVTMLAQAAGAVGDVLVMDTGANALLSGAFCAEFTWMPDRYWICTGIGYSGGGADNNWHNLGAAGEPAFQNGWLQYPGFSTCRFRKLSSGLVVLAGLFNNSDYTGKNGTVAFTLPVGYRPDLYRHMGAAATDQFAVARVAADGTVQFNYSAAGWFSLDNVSFYP